MNFIFTYAYLDAGTGSQIVQILIGFIVGLGFIGKSFYAKIKTIFSVKLSRRKNNGKNA